MFPSRPSNWKTEGDMKLNKICFQSCWAKRRSFSFSYLQSICLLGLGLLKCFLILIELLGPKRWSRKDSKSPGEPLERQRFEHTSLGLNYPRRYPRRLNYCLSAAALPAKRSPQQGWRLPFLSDSLRQTHPDPAGWSHQRKQFPSALRK